MNSISEPPWTGSPHRRAARPWLPRLPWFRTHGYSGYWRRRGYATLGGGVAIEAHNDRLGTAELGDRFKDAVGDFHAGGDAAIDIDEHGFDLRVGQYDLQAFGHDGCGGAAADVQEVGRA